MKISVGDSVSGPWRALGDPLVGAAGTHGANTFNEVWQEFGFPTTASRYWKWEISSRHGGYQAWVGEVEFYGTSDWGWSVITILFASTAVYLGVGMGRNFRVDGSTGLAALPHRAFWLEAKALVADGVLFSRRRLRGKPGRSKAVQSVRQSLVENGSDLHGRAGVDELGKTRYKKKHTNKKRKQNKSQITDTHQAAANSDPVPATDTRGLEDTGETKASGTAASGGGRWVHVPH